MLNLASLCFPDREKSCFFCCPPIREPEADPLDDVKGRCEIFRQNRRRLQENLAHPREIPGTSCWGLGFLDDREQQVGCLLHPLQNEGRELRHLTGYQFKCANALCREARVFAELGQDEKSFCLNLCRGMDSFTYSSRSNPLMRLLAWEKEMVTLVAAEAKTGPSTGDSDQRAVFIENYGFLWQELDFRLDGYLATRIAGRKGFDFLRRHRSAVVRLRNGIIATLESYRFAGEESGNDMRPCHTLAIPLSLSRLLKFGAGRWELPKGCEGQLMAIIENGLAGFCDQT